MWKKLGSQFLTYILPTVNAAGATGLAIFTFWVSIWVADMHKVSEKSLNTTKNISRIEIIKENGLDFSTPIPYLFLCAAFTVLGTIDNFVTRHRYGLLSKTENELRSEKQRHGESKRNFWDALCAALKYLLAKDQIGFDTTCRVTVYRQQQSDELDLKQIFRHSPTRAYKEGGRIRIPSDEGVVGAAWHNHGEMEFVYSGNTPTQEDEARLKAEIAQWNCCLPDTPLSMPSRHLYASRLNDPVTGRPIAIIVYESTKPDQLNIDEIRSVLRDDSLNVARYIRHLGILDTELNPDPGV